MPKSRFAELAETVAARIADGTLAPGTLLPTHRAFADHHGVALATATRTYRELEKRGLIVGERGRGVFVRDAGVPASLGIEQSVSDGLVDLVFNMPGNMADAEMLRSAIKRLAAGGDLEAMLRYQPHAGRPHERKVFATEAGRRLGHVDPDHLLVTSGCQHALSLVVIGLIGRGETIGVDPLTYAGFKTLAAVQNMPLVAVEGEGGLMSPDALDRLCHTKPLRAVYLMPTVHNPLGAVMNEDTRCALVSVARKHDLLLIEDAAYAFLETDPPPTFRELAPERTVHVGGYSKSIGTGLRVGYLVSPARYVDRLLTVIRATTWNTPALMSSLVTAWIEDGTLAQCEAVRREDGFERQKLCREILGGDAVTGHRNAGFGWLPLQPGERAGPLVARLKEKGVAVSPGAPYAATEPVPQALRLAFGGVPMADLEEALKTICFELGEFRKGS